MSRLDELSAALVKADEAGNTEDAKALADAIRSLPEEAPQPHQPALLGSLISGAEFAGNEVRSVGEGMSLSLGSDVGPAINAGIDQLEQYLGTDILGSGNSGNETFKQALERRSGADKTRMDTFTEEHPVADFAGRVAGGLAFAPLTKGKNLPAIAGIEAILGGIEGFGSSEDKFSQQGLIDTAVGATVSGVSTGLLGKLGRPSMADRVGDATDEAIKRAELRAGASNTSLGMNFTIPGTDINFPGKTQRLVTRATQNRSKGGKAFEASAGTTIVGSAARTIDNNFDEALNREAILSIGQEVTPGKRLTADVMQDAQQDLGAAFEDVFANTNILVDQQYRADINAIAKNAKKALKGGSASKTVERLKDRLDAALPVNNGSGLAGRAPVIDARELQNLRSELITLTRDAKRANKSTLAKSLGDLTSATDEVIERGFERNVRTATTIERELPNAGFDTSVGVTSGKLAKWRDTNAKWKNFAALDANDFVVNPATGDVNGKQLFRQMSKQAGGGRKIPETPLGDLARISTIPQVPNSGTASRLLVPGAAATGIASPEQLIKLGAMVLGGRVFSEIAQRTPRGLLGPLGGATARAGDLSGLLSAEDIVGTPSP